MKSEIRASTFVAIALGSNLGDRRGHIDSAIAELRTFLNDLRVSTFIETEAIPPGSGPLFVNAAVAGTATLPPRALLAALQAIETKHGRERSYLNAPRTLDLDLILYGNRLVEEPGLRVPHPRFRERRFVLEPLAEIAPDAVDPVTGLTVGQLLGALHREDLSRT